MKAWVIQEGRGMTTGRQRYYAGWGGPPLQSKWTSHISRAIRFARRIDATRSVGTPEGDPEWGDYFRFIEHEFSDSGEDTP